MSVLTTIRQSTVKNSGLVTSVADVGDGLRRLAFAPHQAELTWRPGQALAVVVDPTGRRMKDRWRHYTIRRRDPDDGALELLVALHDDPGPGARWAAGLSPGDEFTFMGPGGGPALEGHAAPPLVVGDRTSAASAGAILDALDPATPAVALLATPDPGAADLDTSRASDVRWVAATSSEEIRSRLVESVADVILEPDVRAYVTGERDAMRAVRGVLRDRGVPKRRIGVHAHWTPGRTGM